MKVGEILKAARERLKIEALNAMQQAVWQSRGERMVVLSPTGSGKTVAFAGAMLQRLSGGEHQLPAALVLAPSRELVIQIGEVLRSLARGLKVATFYGRHAMADEVNTLSGHPDIIVATPGRLLDHLQKGNVEPSAL
ncbi:MAG: DEAD/DEAH box helicase, partial [Muribaculaceae bacterium]